MATHNLPGFTSVGKSTVTDALQARRRFSGFTSAGKSTVALDSVDWPLVVPPTTHEGWASVTVSAGWVPNNPNVSPLTAVNAWRNSYWMESSAAPSSLELTGTIRKITPPPPGVAITAVLAVEMFGGTTGQVVGNLKQGSTVISTATSHTLPMGLSTDYPNEQIFLVFPASDLTAVTNWAGLSLQLLFTAS